MAKYKVQLGSLVTKLMTRTFTVSAQNEAEAIEKATNRFYYAAEQQKMKNYINAALIVVQKWMRRLNEYENRYYQTN